MTAKAELAPAVQLLLQQIAVRYADTEGRRCFPVFNPATGAHIADVVDMGAQDALAAVEAASAAFPDWSARMAAERGQILRRWHDLILENKEALGQLLTLEQGKPLVEAIGEVGFGAGFVEWFAEEGKRLYGDVIPSNVPGKRSLVIKQPLGVVGAITPWNFPSAMVTRKVSPALAAGCTVVLKPAEDTPLSALALAMLAERAGLPAGALNIVTASKAPEIAEVLTAHPDVRKISFTGSTRVGKLLMEKSAAMMKRLSLELGGNAPFIVFNDADIDAAIAGLMVTKFRNSGQTCVTTNRVFVQSGVLATFSEKLKQALKAITVGNGFDMDSRIGPLINAAAVNKVEQLVTDAVTAGAVVETGGGRHELGGNFFEPTLLTNVAADMRVFTEEVFGPVISVRSFETEEEAIALANDTRYGLAAYFWSRDIGRVFRVGEALDFGMVGANEVLSGNPATPFGGVKESGQGREGSRYGLDDFVNVKYLALGGI